VLHAQDHAENIRVERRGIAFRGLVRDRANLAFGASEPKERSSLTSALPASSRRPATTTFAPFLAKATAAARPMPVKAPVINTTGLLIYNPRNLLPYRQSMEVNSGRGLESRFSLKAM
jgi:hypothetical protein